MAERLIAALEKDIAALKDGRARRSMVSLDPEIQKLTAHLWPRSAEFRYPPGQIGPGSRCGTRFVAITAKFREVLQAACPAC